MAARRGRGRLWASRRGPKAKGVWFTDFATGTAAPLTNTADSDVILAPGDYEVGDSQKEKVRVKRILLEVRWNAVSVNAALGGNFMVDFALVATNSDMMAATVTNNLNLTSLYVTDQRIIRGHTFVMQEAMRETAVGAYTPPRAPSWKVSLKTNFLLTDPQGLYLYQKRSVDLDSSSDSYEYSYRARVYYVRVA